MVWLVTCSTSLWWSELLSHNLLEWVISQTKSTASLGEWSAKPNLSTTSLSEWSAKSNIKPPLVSDQPNQICSLLGWVISKTKSMYNLLECLWSAKPNLCTFSMSVSDQPNQIYVHSPWVWVISQTKSMYNLLECDQPNQFYSLTNQPTEAL